MSQITDSLSESHIQIYADGACSLNPGPGGYGVVMIEGAKRTEFSGGYRKTTNNRMELCGVIAGLQAVVPAERNHITVFSDSRYIVDMVNAGHAIRWRENNWMRNRRDRAVNIDLWKKLLTLCENLTITFIWVKGHSSNQENARCDELAVAARQQKELPADNGYEMPFTPDEPQLTLFDLI